MRKINQQNVFRIIDANLNRVKEALRVCEDICRFILDDAPSTKKYKTHRHAITDVIASLKITKLIQSRNIAQDVGKGSSVSEFKRKEIADIFYANSQRAKESIRVLEEFTKLLNKNCAHALKAIRYKIYALEKTVAQKF